mgnify:CR=1 FL=1
MADFQVSFEKMIISEGGYRLTDIPGDRGQQTYAGIARKPNPQWMGWSYVDRGETPPSDLVRGFYRESFWEPIRGDSIMRQDIADSLFSFAVNAGTGTAIKLAQIVVGATPDGKVGAKTLMAINSMQAEIFRPAFSLAKIARYYNICRKDKSQRVFLMGWLARTLNDASQ